MAIELPVNPFDPSNPPLPTQTGTFGPADLDSIIDAAVAAAYGSSLGSSITSELLQNSSATQKVPPPRPIKNFEIKQKLLRPALTSHFQCWFNPPQSIRDRTNYNGNEEFYSISCSDASLPGSSLATNEINDDYHGVTERFAYRRQYDNTSDFTFYVDHQYANQSYNIIRFFESWISYACGEDKSNLDADNFTYRVRFPDGPTGYRSSEIFILKFERDFVGKALLYRFKKAYPTSITSMPVSYESSQLLKCTVSFTYDRYILGERTITKPTEPGQERALGVPNPPNPIEGEIGDFFTGPSNGPIA